MEPRRCQPGTLLREKFTAVFLSSKLRFSFLFAPKIYRIIVVGGTAATASFLAIAGSA
jgi:hypothetical protein